MIKTQREQPTALVSIWVNQSWCSSFLRNVEIVWTILPPVGLCFHLFCDTKCLYKVPFWLARWWESLIAFENRSWPLKFRFTEEQINEKTLSLQEICIYCLKGVVTCFYFKCYTVGLFAISCFTLAVATELSGGNQCSATICLTLLSLPEGQLHRMWHRTAISQHLSHVHH